MSTFHCLGDIVAERYRITAALGNQNSSNTYIAEDFVRNKLVAIKAISLRQMNDWKDLELLERQAKVLASIDHRAIPRYIEYFYRDTESDRSFYLVQQLIEGESLADLVNNGWRANEAEARNIARQALEILKYLHQQTPAVIHRDIQPCNLLRDTDGRIFLVDFGSVKATCTSFQNYSSTVVGDYEYISSEQIKGKACFASDLYGLGASLLFVLTGKTPDACLQGQTKIHLRRYVQLSTQFASWLEKMLEPSLKARFHSASEAIASLQQQKPPSALKPPAQPKSALELPTSEQKNKSFSKKTAKKQQPAGSRVILRRSDGRLVIEVLPRGLPNSNSNVLDFFSWWYRLEIYSQKFFIFRGNLGFQTSREGKTCDIIKAELKVESSYWGEMKHSVLIWEGITAHNFAPELTSVEKEWLVDEITDFLDYLQLLKRLEKVIDES